MLHAETRSFELVMAVRSDNNISVPLSSLPELLPVSSPTHSHETTLRPTQIDFSSDNFLLMQKSIDFNKNKQTIYSL